MHLAQRGGEFSDEERPPLPLAETREHVLSDLAVPLPDAQPPLAHASTLSALPGVRHMINVSLPRSAPMLPHHTPF